MVVCFTPQVVEVEAEPAYEVVEVEGEEEGPLRLALEGTCDYVSLECETSNLSFRPTMMFQTRTHSFPITNSGSVALHFSLAVVGASGEEEGDSPFTVTPQTGTIPAGGSCSSNLPTGTLGRWPL